MNTLRNIQKAMKSEAQRQNRCFSISGNVFDYELNTYTGMKRYVY